MSTARFSNILPAGAALLTAFALCGQFYPELGGWLAVGVILIVGFPHGADDISTLTRLRGGSLSSRRFVQIAAYVAIMATMLVTWLIAPAVALSIFLAVSIWHFGQDHASALGLTGRPAGVYAVAWGSFVLLAPLCWSPGELIPVVEAIAGVAPGYGVIEAIGRGATLAAAGCALYTAVAYARTQDVHWLGELALLVLLAHCFNFLPPLWAFAFFFVCVHAPTSLGNQLAWRGERATTSSLRSFLRRSAPYAVAAVGIIVGITLLSEGGHRLDAQWLSRFFVLISAFTLPHALVVHRATSQFTRDGDAAAQTSSV